MESTRAEEAKVKRETAEGLAAFRRQQEDIERKARENEGAESPSEDQETWAAGVTKKRRRAKEKEGFKGLKRRRSSTSKQMPIKEKASTADSKVEAAVKDATPEIVSSMRKSADIIVERKVPLTKGLGLAAYGSDSDDD